MRLSGTGDAWFVGPAALPDPAALYPGHTLDEMQADLGDSAIIEVYGLGALAIGASPLSAPSVGLDVATIGERMAAFRSIAAGEHPALCAARRPGDPRRRRARGGGDRDRPADPHRHRAPRAGRRADRRRGHAAAVARPSSPPSRSSIGQAEWHGQGQRHARDLSRRACLRRAARAPAARRPAGRPPARRAAARRRLRDEPHPGARGAAPAGGRRAHRARPGRRAVAERAERQVDAGAV